MAADLIGPLLYSSDVAGLVAGAGLLSALAFLRRRGEVALGGRLYLCEAGVAVAAACAAVNYWVFAPRIESVQLDLVRRYGAFHLAEKADPLLLRFGSLHRTSTTVFMVGFAAALVGLVCMTQFRPRSPSASPPPSLTSATPSILDRPPTLRSPREPPRRPDAPSRFILGRDRPPGGVAHPWSTSTPRGIAPSLRGHGAGPRRAGRLAK